MLKHWVIGSGAWASGFWGWGLGSGLGLGLGLGSGLGFKTHIKGYFQAFL